MHLQLFPSFQEGLKACAHPTYQPSVRRPLKNWEADRLIRVPALVGTAG
jgi:hypothetical protein